MPPEMEPCGGGKGVLISVYVERTRDRRLSFHKPRQLPQPVNRRAHGETLTGYSYSKKAQLLLYVQQKRESSRLAGASVPALTSQRPQTPTQVVAVKNKLKPNSTSSCFGSWKRKLPVPCFFQPIIFHLKKKRNRVCGSTGKKIKLWSKKSRFRNPNPKCWHLCRTASSTWEELPTSQTTLSLTQSDQIHSIVNNKGSLEDSDVIRFMILLFYHRARLLASKT
uniref:Uncharacterized protein n=1 Tax=Kalanchoe fedtschenkoi TaxID=63787 RepID=A0A7N0VFM6_KALFE